MRIMIVIVGILAIVLCNFQPAVVTTINWIFTGRTAFCNAGYWLMLETQYYSCNDHYVCIMDRKYRMDNLWTAGASGNGKFPSGISVHDCFSDPWPCSDSRAAWNKTWIFPLIQRRKSGLLGKGGKDRW